MNTILNDRLDELRQAVLLKRLQKQVIARSAQRSEVQIIQAARGRELPLSYAQQRLWFLDQLNPAAGAAYHMPAALRLRGCLKKDVLRAVLDRLVERHETLRTRFVSVAERAAQWVEAADSGFTLRESDLSHLPEADREQEIARIGAAEVKERFDLSKGPLIRGQLLRLGKEEHVLLITQHHIISDGWSIGIMIREVRALYAAFSQGLPDPLPVLEIQYADYAIWQREWLQGEVLQRQVQYWKEQLAGAPSLLTLPTDRPRPAMQSYAGARVHFELSRQLAVGLRALSQRHGTTLFMTLLAGWAVLLGRLSGQSEVVIGTPLANRRRVELERLIGFFVNTLALRVRLAGDPTVSELLRQVKVNTLEAYEHQDVPFEQVVDALQPVRSMSHSPVFQVLLSLNNTPTGGALSLPGLRIEAVEQAYETSQFDMGLLLTETTDGIAATLNYATDLFDAETLERLGSYLVNVLGGMVAGEAQRVSQLPLLSETQRQQVLHAFNDTVVAYPQEGLLHELFEARVRESPGAVAVEYEQEELSYEQLNRRANRLAHHLLAQGVKPDDRVGICLERGPALVWGILGILKAGGAFVPLDPAYPEQRLAYMLSDSAPVALVTQASLAERFGEAGVPLVVLDADGDAAALADRADGDAGAASLRLSSRNLAYVIYTSGSTGAPKGVMVEHRGLCNLVLSQIESFAVHRTDRVLQFVSVSFDVCISEITLALCSGASLHLASPSALLPGEALLSTVRSHRITHLTLPKSVLATLPYDADLGEVHTLITGGEVLTPDLAEHWSNHYALFNCYGPTETTVCATVHRCGAPYEGAVPIGVPLSNVRIYILDEHRQPVPIGVTGELYIGGAGVARGYLNRPELTEERFLEDPFSPDESGRMYRTGDLARYRADGNIEFLGRNDFQVKIRGFRIELGEIEARLLECAGVREAVALAREDDPGEKRLVAYVTPLADSQIDVTSLQERLSQRLPQYMVPAAIVLLAELPLTPNGKVDREALPVPDFTPAISRPPRTPQEEILVTLFAEVLGLDEIGVDDSFFDMGGHSLLATRLISRIRSTLGVELPLDSLFDSPTVAGIARRLGQGVTARVALRPRPRPGLIPLSFAQQRLWFLHRLQGPNPTYNLPTALRLDGPLDAGALQMALNDLILRHESLRTTFTEIEGVAQQTVLPPALAQWQFEVLDTNEGALTGLLRHRARYAFDLTREIPVRVTLFRLSETQHVVLLLMHHIATDADSLTPLTRDLANAYSARCEGRVHTWAPLPVQYADYTLWQREWLGEESDPNSVIAGQIAYWKETLAGLPEQLSLPTDRPRPAQPSHVGQYVRLNIDAAAHRKLLDLARDCQVTPFMVMHAAIAVLLTKLGAGTDIPLGTSLAGRTDDALEDLVGFFVNLLVLRTDTSGNPSFRELLARVRKTDLAAYAHQDLPFERQVELVNPVRSVAHHPLFQVLLVLTNSTSGSTEMTGLNVSRQPMGVELARYDLRFSVQERRAADGTPEGIFGGIEYACDLFDHSTIEAMAERLCQVLHLISHDPDQSIGSIDLLTASERRQILVDWNATHYPVADTTLPQLFEQQVDKNPSAIALIGTGAEMTYGELNAHANRLAHELIMQGIGPERIVGICLPRSTDLIVALLGVLKSGAAYLPLDPQYPRERLALMIEDARPAQLITTTALEHRLPAGTARILLDTPQTSRGLLELPATNPTNVERLLSLFSQHPAYVIYTSGSTGRPKGVVVTHGNLSNYLAWVTRAYYCQAGGPQGDGGSPMVFSISFDAGVTTVFGALMSGQPLRLLPTGDEVNQLASVGRTDEPYTLVKVTPSHLKLITQAVAAHDGPSPTRVLMTGGEAMVPADVAYWQHRYPAVRIVNHFGPTETTVGCATFNVDADVSANTSIPIGRPIWNVKLYVLDAALQPVPPGVPGELYIGGDGLARGYLNSAALTAERFVANPFGGPDAGTGGRLYRSGDLVRWLRDGTLDYMGRMDQQVKLHGFRVELCEIEACLLRHPAVAHANVIAREDRPGQKLLVGYVVASSGHRIDPLALRSSLAEQLPEYMVPAALVVLDAIPMTTNGKLDRKRLPAPDFTPSVSRAPRSLQEEILAGLFAEVLGVSRVGVNDSFFDLGGHSLLAIRLVSRIIATLQVEMPIRLLYEAPTVAGLAALLKDPHKEHTSGVLLPLRKTGGGPPLFCLPPAGSMPWCYAGLAGYIRADGPVYGLQAPDLDEAAAHTPNIAGDVRLYLDEIRKIQPHGPYHLLGWSIGGLVAHALAVELQRSGEHVALLALLDAYPRSPDESTGSSFEVEPWRLDQYVLAMALSEFGAPPPLHALPQAGLNAMLDDLVTSGTLSAEDKEPLARMARSFKRSIHLATTFAPDVFTGSMTFFRATLGGEAGPSRSLAQWAPLVSGDIEVHDIQSTHFRMLDPTHRASIGTVLTRRLTGENS